jgi:hypothetical protein
LCWSRSGTQWTTPSEEQLFFCNFGHSIASFAIKQLCFFSAFWSSGENNAT